MDARSIRLDSLEVSRQMADQAPETVKGSPDGIGRDKKQRAKLPWALS